MNSGAANMTIRANAHKTAMCDLVETITAASALALLTDLGWAIRDSMLNGFTAGMILIIIGLSIASIVTLCALYKYHHNAVKKIIKEQMRVKLGICKAKAKRGK